MFKLDLEKAKEPAIKLPTSTGSSKKRESSINTSVRFIDYAFDSVDHNKLGNVETWKILKEMEIPDHLTCLLRNLNQKQKLEPDMEQGTGLKLGKEYFKGVYCHSAYLFYIQSTS